MSIFLPILLLWYLFWQATEGFSKHMRTGSVGIVLPVTFSGGTLGGRQRSRLSIGARALGTPPDPTLMPRPLHAAPPTPPLPAPYPPSARAGPQPAALPQGGQERPEVAQRGLSVPYTQRLQTAGVVCCPLPSSPSCVIHDHSIRHPPARCW